MLNVYRSHDWKMICSQPHSRMICSQPIQEWLVHSSFKNDLFAAHSRMICSQPIQEWFVHSPFKNDLFTAHSRMICPQLIEECSQLIEEILFCIHNTWRSSKVQKSTYESFNSIVSKHFKKRVILSWLFINFWHWSMHVWYTWVVISLSVRFDLHNQ